MTDAELRELYKRAIDINRQAFVGEEFDIAYHALMTAVHCGQTLGDLEYLAEAERLAKNQLIYIDTHRPEYHHSTKSAAGRGRVSIFETAARQARAKISMLKRAKMGFGEVQARTR
jgi:hypothetical protein